MQKLLTYDEFISIGGVCDITAFNRHIIRACGILNNETGGRVGKLKKVSEAVKFCLRDMVDLMAANIEAGETPVQSASQSVGGLSESYSYAVKTDEELKDSLSELVYDYLLGEVDGNGVSLLYRGRGA